MQDKIERLLLLAILVLGLGLRLYHVTYPYLDHHSWRQTDTAAIARNFHRNGFNILKPEVDWAGGGRSVAELEFQITPFLTAALYSMWGVQDWVGRVVPILFWVGALTYFYLLVKRLADVRTALFGAFAFAILPLDVFFTRVPMPESGTAFFAIAAVYFLRESVETGRMRDYGLAILFATLAFLTKLTYLFLLAPLAFVAWEGHRRYRAPVGRLTLFFAASLAITLAYYGYMHATSDVKLIPYKVGSDKWGNLSTWSNPVFYRVIFERLRSVIFTDLGLLLLAVGLWVRVKTRLFHVWLLSAFAYVFLVATGNLVHSYYQIPVIPAGAFFIGLALSRISSAGSLRPIAGFLCGALLYLSVVNALPMYGMYAWPAYEAALELKKIDAARSLVVYVPHRPDLNPEMLYYADRKGWIVAPRQVSVATIEQFRKRGARYLVLPRPRTISSDLGSYLGAKTVWVGSIYLIFEL